MAVRLASAVRQPWPGKAGRDLETVQPRMRTTCTEAAFVMCAGLMVHPVHKCSDLTQRQDRKCKASLLEVECAQAGLRSRFMDETGCMLGGVLREQVFGLADWV
jgi:hypothetical protein